MGRRTFRSVRLVRYYIGPASARAYQQERPKYPRRITSTRAKRVAEYVRSRLIDCHRAFATHPVSRSDYLWTEDSPENLRAEAEREHQPLTHLDQKGQARMVEITGKAETKRVAVAVATLLFSNKKTYDALCSQQVVKGNAEAVSRLAAIQGAKKTSDLVPLAHPSIGITAVSVDVRIFGPEERLEIHKCYEHDKQISELWSKDGGVTITSTVKCEGKTGVEMEALTASTIGAVTMYDMLKAIDKGMVIMGARVIQKEGGKSGDWAWDETKNDFVSLTNAGSTIPIRSVPSVDRSIKAPVSSQQKATAVNTEARASLSSSTDIDEWNQGLTSEFSLPESTRSDPNKQETTSNVRPKKTRKEEPLSGATRDRRIPSRHIDTIKQRSFDADLKFLNSHQPESQHQGQLHEDSDSIKRIKDSTQKLDLRLLSIQKSRFVRKIAQDRYGKEEPLDRGSEWIPDTMSPVTRDDITGEQHRVDARDFRGKVMQRYEEQGGGSGGSVIR